MMPPRAHPISRPRRAGGDVAPLLALLALLSLTLKGAEAHLNSSVHKNRGCQLEDGSACADVDPGYPRGSDLSSTSPCPPPPNAICLTIPYRAEVGDPRTMVGDVPETCEGSFAAKTACLILKAADRALRFVNAMSVDGPDTRMEGRVKVSHPLDAKTARSLGGVIHTPSTWHEFDHSLSMMCALRDRKVCGAVARAQRAYNASHTAMEAAAAVADAAFDRYEATKKTCKELTEKLDEIDEAARTGKKVCRDRVREVGTDLVDKLEDVRSRLLAVDDASGGTKCSKRALYEASSMMRGEDITSENAARPKGAGRVVGIARTLEDGTKVEVGDDENSSTIVLDNGYVMPEEYFSECQEIVGHLDAMIKMLGKRQRVREHVCAEYTAEEIAEFRAMQKKACAALAGLKHAYASQLAEAQRWRKHVEAAYGELLDAEEKARAQTRTIDGLIAGTAAAGGNAEAAADLAAKAEAEAKRARERAERACADAGGAAGGSASAEDLDRRTIAAAPTMTRASEVVDAFASYAASGARPSPAAAAALDDAVAARVAKTASLRNAAEVLEAAAAAGASISSAAAVSALDDAVVREAPSATPSRVVQILDAYAAHGKGTPPPSVVVQALADATLAAAPTMKIGDVAKVLVASAAAAAVFPSKVLKALADTVTREAPTCACAGVLGDALGAFKTAKAALPSKTRDALAKATVRLAARMTPKDIARTLAGYAGAGLAAPSAVVGALSEAVERSSRVMDAEEVGEVLGAFAGAGAKMSSRAKAAVHAAAVREAPRMSPSDAKATLDAFSRLRMEASADLREELVRAAVK